MVITLTIYQVTCHNTLWKEIKKRSSFLFLQSELSFWLLNVPLEVSATAYFPTLPLSSASSKLLPPSLAMPLFSATSTSCCLPAAPTLHLAHSYSLFRISLACHLCEKSCPLPMGWHVPASAIPECLCIPSPVPFLTCYCSLPSTADTSVPVTESVPYLFYISGELNEIVHLGCSSWKYDTISGIR